MIKQLHDSNNNRNNQKGKSGNHPEIKSHCHKVLENQNFKINVYKTYILPSNLFLELCSIVLVKILSYYILFYLKNTVCLTM